MNDREFRDYVFRWIAAYQEHLELLRRLGQVQAELSDIKWPNEVWSLDTLADDMGAVDGLERQLDEIRGAHMDARNRMREADAILRKTIPEGVWYRCGSFGVRWFADCQTQLKSWTDILNEKRLDEHPEGRYEDDHDIDEVHGS